jgi:sialic acid synthase SpsE
MNIAQQYLSSQADINKGTVQSSAQKLTFRSFETQFVLQREYFVLLLGGQATEDVHRAGQLIAVGWRTASNAGYHPNNVG